MSTTTITSSGTYHAANGDCFVIAPNVSGTVKFEPAAGAARPVDFVVQLNSSPNDPSKSLTIEAYGSDGALSPALEIASHYNGPNTSIKFSKAADSEISGGDGVTLKEIVGSSTGRDEITFGDDASISDGIKTAGGDDHVEFGNGLFIKDSKKIEMGSGDDTFIAGDDAHIGDIDTGTGDDSIDIGDNAKVGDISTGDGADDVSFGDGARADNISTGDGDDTFEWGRDGFFSKLEMGEGQDDAYVGAFDRHTAEEVGKLELDGGGDGDGTPRDCLKLDLSWLTPEERQAFEDELLSEGYVRSDTGGFVFEDSDNDGEPDESLKVTIKLDLDGDGHDDFTFKLRNWEEINVVCFARGTLIDTEHGRTAIEKLKAGDLVRTLDHGLQKLQWIGSTRVPAEGKFAPIRIKAGAMNNDRDVVVSPQHRILVKGFQVEVMFGEDEVLVPAKHLVNQRNILREEGGVIEYFHMLFDDHEIVFAEGLPSESFHPGTVGLDGMSEATRQEIFELFPQLQDDAHAYGASCRMSLKGFEARAAMASSETPGQSAA